MLSLGSHSRFGRLSGIALWFTLVVAASLSGCSTGPIPTREEAAAAHDITAPEGRSLLFILRRGKYFGSDWLFVPRIDDVASSSQVPAGGFLRVIVDPGYHTIQGAGASLSIQVDRGGVAVVEMKNQMSMSQPVALVPLAMDEGIATLGAMRAGSFNQVYQDLAVRVRQARADVWVTTQADYSHFRNGGTFPAPVRSLRRHEPFAVVHRNCRNGYGIAVLTPAKQVPPVLHTILADPREPSGGPGDKEFHFESAEGKPIGLIHQLRAQGGGPDLEYGFQPALGSALLEAWRFVRFADGTLNGTAYLVLKIDGRIVERHEIELTD